MFKKYFLCLVNPTMARSGVKVALVVGSLLFCINHGAALLKGEMERDRWISAALTYIVPYLVNIHGQFISSYRDN
jgi:hypothetical protein